MQDLQFELLNKAVSSNLPLASLNTLALRTISQAPKDWLEFWLEILANFCKKHDKTTILNIFVYLQQSNTANVYLLKSKYTLKYFSMQSAIDVLKEGIQSNAVPVEVLIAALEKISPKLIVVADDKENMPWDNNQADQQQNLLKNQSSILKSSQLQSSTTECSEINYQNKIEIPQTPQQSKNEPPKSSSSAAKNISARGPTRRRMNSSVRKLGPPLRSSSENSPGSDILELDEVVEGKATLVIDNRKGDRVDLTDVKKKVLDIIQISDIGKSDLLIFKSNDDLQTIEENRQENISKLSENIEIQKEIISLESSSSISKNINTSSMHQNLSTKEKIAIPSNKLKKSSQSSLKPDTEPAKKTLTSPTPTSQQPQFPDPKPKEKIISFQNTNKHLHNQQQHHTAQQQQHTSTTSTTQQASETKTLQNSHQQSWIAGGNVEVGEFVSSSKDKSFFMVNSVRYQKLGLIGKGGSSKVYKIMNEKTGRIFALKKVKLKGQDQCTIDGYLNEVSLLKRLRNNDRIIKLIDFEASNERETLILVLEYGEIDLSQLLQKQVSCLSPNFIRMYWEQMLKAVHAIHEENIIHSDLKPANFMLVEGSLKLIDFGIAKTIPNDTTNIHRDHQTGTINYMSPEAINFVDSTSSSGLKLGRSSDVWSLGCILYQLIYGKTPFASLSMLKKLHVISDRGHQIDFPDLEDRILLGIVRGCLVYDKEKRFTIPELLKSSYVTGVFDLKGELMGSRSGKEWSCVLEEVVRRIQEDKVCDEDREGQDVQAKLARAIYQQIILGKKRN